MPLISTPPKLPKNLRKHAPGKVRTQWPNCNHGFNPIKINQFNTLGTNPTDINKTNIIKITPQKACQCFGATCSFCRWQVLHPFIPRPKPDNSTLNSVDSLPFQGLTIQTDEPDKKAPEVLTILIPPIEPGAVGTVP